MDESTLHDATSDRLFQVWNEARGRKAPTLNPEDEAVIRRNLVARYRAVENPQPLLYCSVCCVKARGEHSPR